MKSFPEIIQVVAIPRWEETPVELIAGGAGRSKDTAFVSQKFICIWVTFAPVS